MSAWTFTEQLSSSERLEVLHLLLEKDTELGRESLDETRRRAVLHGSKGHHWLRKNEGHVCDYAQAVEGEILALERCGAGVDDDLLSMLLDRHHQIDWWVRDGDAEPTNAVRSLQLLAIDLPQPVLSLPESASLDAFIVGRDEDEWLLKNNEAFMDHPEQGAWRREDLLRRIAEPWFDSAGMILLRIDGVLAGSCWTKVQELFSERFGEIYVLSVSPAFQGMGLGKILLSQGLHTLQRRGVRQARLFVDVSNHGAHHLYTSMGFTLMREDQLLRFSND